MSGEREIPMNYHSLNVSPQPRVTKKIKTSSENEEVVQASLQKLSQKKIEITADLNNNTPII